MNDETTEETGSLSHPVTREEMFSFTQAAALLAEVVERKQRSLTQRTFFAVGLTVATFLGVATGTTLAATCFQATATVSYCKVIPGYSTRTNFGKQNNDLAKQNADILYDIKWRLDQLRLDSSGHLVPAGPSNP